MTIKPIKIGFFSAKNYLDKNIFSGTLYSMYNALKAREIEIIDLGNPQKPSLINNSLKSLKNLFLSGNQSNKTQLYNRMSRAADKKLKRKPCDLIFAPVATKELVFLNTNLPIIYLSDATPKLIKGDYPRYKNEEEFLIASNQEKAAIYRANKLVYPSQWAANSAILDYGGDPNKIEIVPFGANVTTIPDAREILNKCKISRCRLLFIGKDWKRKGGEIAFNTLVSLTQMGIDAELVILGCVPPPEYKHENLTVIPFLNKNIPQEQKQFIELLLNSHFLIFPTRADCSPIVICEANAYGIPVIAPEIGGIPTILRNAHNGYMLPCSASSDEYAQAIANTFPDREAYKKLVQSSRLEYDTRLNWDKWAERFHQISLDTLKSSQST